MAVQDYDETQTYRGTFLLGPNHERYGCQCIEAAISADSATDIQECVRRGILTKNHRTLANDTVLHRAVYLNKTAVAAKLRELGFPE